MNLNPLHSYFSHGVFRRLSQKSQIFLPMLWPLLIWFCMRHPSKMLNSSSFPQRALHLVPMLSTFPWGFIQQGAALNLFFPYYLFFSMWFTASRYRCPLHTQNICTKKINLKTLFPSSSTTKPDPKSVERIEFVTSQ